MTARTDSWRELLQELADALRSVDLDVSADDALVADGVTLVPQIIERAHPTTADLRDIVDEGRGSATPVLIADRISEAGRATLRDAGWGWLDRRGHLRLWSPGVRIEVPLPGRSDDARARSGNPWTPVGLEVALAGLIDPETAMTARRVAPIIDRSVGAVHESIRRFTAEGLIGPRTGLALLPDLFWDTSAHWPDDGWTGLPLDADELGAVLAETIDPHELIRVDERAATLGGARIPAAGELPARFYLTGSGGLRRARALAERDAPIRSWVREAPVRWLPRNDDHPADDTHPWTVAHPMVCALRLAADPARGREVVEAWDIVAGEDPWNT